MSSSGGAPVGRRVVLGLVGLGVVGVAAGDYLASLTAGVASSVSPAVGQVIPAAGGFRIYTVTNGYPERSTADYRLVVSDRDRRVELTYAEVQALPQSTITKDFQCVTGWRVEDATWSGVVLTDLLAELDVDLGGRPLRFTSFDGAYTESLTADQAALPDVMVATHLWNEPLSTEMGGPVRLVVPQMYGYKSLKWLDGIHVTSEVVPGYWEERGYDIDAWVGKSNGRSDDPVT